MSQFQSLVTSSQSFIPTRSHHRPSGVRLSELSASPTGRKLHRHGRRLHVSLTSEQLGHFREKMGFFFANTEIAEIKRLGPFINDCVCERQGTTTFSLHGDCTS